MSRLRAGFYDPRTNLDHHEPIVVNGTEPLVYALPECRFVPIREYAEQEGLGHTGISETPQLIAARPGTVAIYRRLGDPVIEYPVSYIQRNNARLVPLVWASCELVSAAEVPEHYPSMDGYTLHSIADEAQ